MTTTVPAPPVRIVPTVSQPVRIPWGDWAEQALVHETTLIENAAEAGVQIVAGLSPLAAVVVGLAGPVVVKQIVDQGLTLAEGMLAGQGITIQQPNWLESYAVTAMNKYFPNLAARIGDDLTPQIQAAIAKAAPPSSPVVAGSDGKIGAGR